jgi:hypothetical protein
VSTSLSAPSYGVFNDVYGFILSIPNVAGAVQHCGVRMSLHQCGVYDAGAMGLGIRIRLWFTDSAVAKVWGIRCLHFKGVCWKGGCKDMVAYGDGFRKLICPLYLNTFPDKSYCN